jgi:hypothetical protein
VKSFIGLDPVTRNRIKPGKAIGGSSVAEHSSLHPEVEGSSPAVTADTINESENDKNVFKDVYKSYCQHPLIFP